MATPSQLADMIVAEIDAALALHDIAARTTALRAAARRAFATAYDDVGGDPRQAEMHTADFTNTLNGAMGQTIPDGTGAQAERVAAIWATAATNAAIVAATPPGERHNLRRTWITMQDDKVRDLHQPMHGVTVAAGERFNVGGFMLRYPGEPIGPPEVWINCRCTLQATLTAATEGAPMADQKPSSYDDDACPEGQHLDPDTDECVDDDNDELPEFLRAASDKPWGQFSAGDYTIEQWRRACLLKMPDGDPESKGTYKLPVREPSGALNVNGVHAAAAALGGARGGVSAPPEAKAAAKRKLRGLYRQLGEDPPDSLKADAGDVATEDALVAWPKSTSPPGTHDAPGWVTNPRETQRLRTYWTRGAGAAKIRWGAPGDFDRCRRQLVKYVPNPSYLAGTCANLHFVALGYWPNHGPHAGKHGSRRSSGEPIEFDNEETATVTAAFADADATFVDDPQLPPRDWFTDPGFDAPTPLTVTSDGRVLGHLATWGTCHVGISGNCTEAPHSLRDYAYFRTGETETASGEMVPVGQITMDTGHAPTDLGPTAAVGHYDDTGTVVADVAAGEDDHGIWVAGALRPGVSDDQRRSLMAGALSGDWRRIGGNLELVAALVVNVPGFPIPRTQVASASGHEVALVAAAPVVVDPNALDVERVALAVSRALARRDRATALMKASRAQRVDAISAALR